MRVLASSCLLFAAVVSGCATGSTSAGPRLGSKDRPVQMAPLLVRSNPDPLVGLSGYDAQTLLDLGSEAFRAENYPRAAELFERLLAEFPESDLAHLARYNAGLSRERHADWARAVEHFSDLVSAYPNAESSVDAHFHLARSYGKLKDWEKVAKTFQDIQNLPGELPPMDEIEARAGTSVGLFMQGDHPSAEREFRQLIRFYENHTQRDSLPAEYFLGQARFYLGEIQAKAFERSELWVPVGTEDDVWVERIGQQLESKCDLLLKAQARFIRVIRVGHRGWATAAGFRIGALYESLFDALLDVPVPPDLNAEAREIYRDELRSRAGILVKKAIRVYEANQEMAERVGENNEWVDKTAIALERVKKLYLAATTES